MGQFVQHLSVRVPWHDSGWNGRICDSPLDNTACVLLENIGLQRDDDSEVATAGEYIAKLPGTPPPCIAERANFLCDHKITITKKHPYQWKEPLANIEQASLTIPAWSVHAIPYYWLAREHVPHIQEQEPVQGYCDELEDEALDLVGFDRHRQTWVLHGDNQKALIETFFSNVVPGQSLVFFYLKFSPFENIGRLLIGAAQVDHLELPGRWPTCGDTAFPNHMWETVLRHTLREDGSGGLLLPMQKLAELALAGVDISASLCHAPDTDREFSYVTEHVSADTAVAALLALQRAAQESENLGCPVPPVSLTWLDNRLMETWERRGVAPGLPAVLSLLGFEYPTFSARTVLSAVEEGDDPWLRFTMALAGDASAPSDMAALATDTKRRIWRKLPPEAKDALRLLTRFDLTPSQVKRVWDKGTTIPIERSELLENPYHLVTCTVDDDEPIRFQTIDLGCFPSDSVASLHPLPVANPLTDAVDRRRVEAVIVDELARAEGEGHTLLPVEEVLDRISGRTFGRPMPLTPLVLMGLDLDPGSLDDDPDANWPVLSRTELASGEYAYKLRPASARVRVIQDFVESLTSQPRHRVPKGLDDMLESVLGPLEGHDPTDLAAEMQARTEKKSALHELYSSRFSILNGPAGTGKTTLIRALVERPEVTAQRVLLLAPTGKARVQLANKVGVAASTIAQYLSHSERYDGEVSRYRVTGNAASRQRYSLVVVDEASMLTEDMLAALCDSLVPPDRFILVGDPRQLPPIGAGRPFVDLERVGRASYKGGWPRITKDWAELTVRCRQKGHVRDDLMLAQWFSGDEIPEGVDEVWERLRRGEEMETLRSVSWDGRRPEDVFDDVLAQELGVRGDDNGQSFAASYGAEVGERISYFSAPQECERWQALSPFRGRGYGTVQLNRHLKEKYRQEELKKAQLPAYQRYTPPPLGPERIVLGDKVVNLVNRRLGYWNREEGNRGGYVANGELGVVIGQIVKKSSRTQIEYSSQLGRRYGAKYKSEDDAPVELAWVLTVHKSQGSEFGIVILVLPAGIKRLSRELLYTALTRQTNRVIICHEGPLDDLMELTRASGSDTCRRLTDLMALPNPMPVTTAAGTSIGILDAGLAHVTDKGILVRSKNEVIIADILDDIAPGAWAYEQPLTGLDGVTRYPDFTISSADGRTIYWEHLGMLGDPGYAAGWERRRAWYADAGILPAESGGGPNGTLMWTDDRTGVDKPAWRAHAKSIIGPARARAAKPAKKISSKKKNRS